MRQRLTLVNSTLDAAICGTLMNVTVPSILQGMNATKSDKERRRTMRHYDSTILLFNIHYHVVTDCWAAPSVGHVLAMYVCVEFVVTCHSSESVWVWGSLPVVHCAFLKIKSTCRSRILVSIDLQCLYGCTEVLVVLGSCYM